MFNDDDDYCYECRGYGNDMYYDEELEDYVSACEECPFNDMFYDDQVKYDKVNPKKTLNHISLSCEGGI